MAATGLFGFQPHIKIQKCMTKRSPQNKSDISLDLAFNELQVPQDSYVYSFELTTIVTNIQSWGK